MINILLYVCLFGYVGAMLVIFLFSLQQAYLTAIFCRYTHQPPRVPPPFSDDCAPLVTVQLPLYNEQYVVARLLRAITALQYPLGKLEIQVLDDSTDDSAAYTRHLVAQYAAEGVAITYHHRQERKGYKAGALLEGLAVARGEFIAIFDADFLPPPNWLYQTMPYFVHSRIGVIQTRWTHINRNYSLLTKIQGFMLDVHFTIEQVGRNIGGYFINFNGTAGIWRKSCIIDAGNWQSDTLTEDLDLSYRAQLRQWQITYLPQVESPAELPIILSAAQSQQFRWNKGGAENLMKLFPRLSYLSGAKWMMAVLHLSSSSVFIVLSIAAVCSVPLLYTSNMLGVSYLWWANSIFGISMFVFGGCYWQSYRYIHGSSLSAFIRYLGMFIAFNIGALGLSFYNARAAWAGLMRQNTAFVRTPKFNVVEPADTWIDNKYITPIMSFDSFLALLLWGYFAFGLYIGYYWGNFSFWFFHLLLVLGLSYVLYLSAVQMRGQR